MVEVDVFALTPIVAAMVGMTVGFVSMWSNIKAQKAKSKEALKTSVEELRKDVREFVELKLDVMDTRVEALRSELKLEGIFTGELNRRSEFFTKWVQRIEDRIEHLPQPEESSKEQQ